MEHARSFLPGPLFPFLITACLVCAPAYAKYAGGSGTANDPYQIATAADLIAHGETPDDYDKHFILTADIDLDPNLPGRRVFDRALIAPNANDAGVSFDGTAFTGVFDGDGHAISNLKIICRGKAFAGLFGMVDSDARISNLGLVSPVIDAGFCAGSLVGDIVEGAVTGCHVKDGTVSGSSRVGGLVGRNFKATIAHCRILHTHVIGRTYTGALVGRNWKGTVTHCRSASTVSGREYIGGLVGQNFRGDSTVMNCRSTGRVSGALRTGGLIGGNDGVVQNSCSGSKVSGFGPVFRPITDFDHVWFSHTGGLVGDNGGTVLNCYATGYVNGHHLVGGLIGNNNRGTVSNCYATAPTVGVDAGPLFGYIPRSKPPYGLFWDTQVTGHQDSRFGTGKTTAEMQTAGPFLKAGWDFVGESENGTEDIWWIREGQDYPRLWWERDSEGQEPRNIKPVGSVRTRKAETATVR